MERSRILVLAVIVLPAAAFGCYRVLSTQDDPVQWVIGILTPIVATLIAAHYLWFYHVAVDAASVTQVKYFGLVRKVIPLSRLTQISAGIFRGWLFNSRSVRFVSANDAIELIADVYDKRALNEAIGELNRLGVPVDEELLKHSNMS